MIPCPLWQQARRQPKTVAIASTERSWTFEEWDNQADIWGQSIHNAGFVKGDRISIVSRDPFKTAALLFGALRIGCAIAIQSDRDPEEAIKNQNSRYQLSPCPKKMRRAHKRWMRKPIVDEKALATILFTSGSTGVPKAVCHSLFAHLHAAKSSEKRTAFGKGDKWGLSLSLWHIGGLAILFRAVVSGGSVYCVPKRKGLSQAISGFGLTHVSMVAVQLKALLDEGCDPSSLKSILVGGGPCSSVLLNRSIDAKLPVKMTYGMTELCSQLCTQTSSDGAAHAGEPLDGWSVKISSEGEVWAKGPSLLLGYLTENAIVSATDDDGWFHTGDRGEIKQRCLYVAGRIDQRFISGGENISPEEIEMAAMNHPGCNMAIAVPIPDTHYGFRPFLFYEGTVSTNDLEYWLKNKLAKFKQPDHIYPWPSGIPLHKPSRSALLHAALDTLKPQNPSL